MKKSLILAAATAVVFAASPAVAQHKNLQALDKNISSDDLKKQMNEFAEQLGVRCTYCHVPDFPEKDDKKRKLDARKMIRLVQQMRASKNDYFKATVKPADINCGVCHRGKPEPEPFVP